MAGGQVYPGRMQAVHEEELVNGGALIVYTQKEPIPRRMVGDIEDPYPASNWGSLLFRDLCIEVHCLVPAFHDDTPETADYTQDAFVVVDRLAAQVEDALEHWEPSGFESAFLRLRDSNTDIVEAEGGMPVARCVMEYWMRYSTPYKACSDPLVDNDSGDMLLRGLYPGGQIIDGCPVKFEGEACPIPGEVGVQLVSVNAEVPSSL